MNKIRLAKLADFLETVPEDKFNMDVWAYLGNKTSLGDCGTAGCALGWATKIFPELTINFSFSNPYPDLYFEGFRNYSALELFFDLDFELSRDLFSALRYPDPANISPQEVANKIRQAVEAQ